MSPPSITITKGALPNLENSRARGLIPFEEIKSCVVRGKFWPYLFRYHSARLVTYRLNTLSKPFLTALLLRLLSRGECYFEDELEHRIRIDTKQWLLLGKGLLRDSMGKWPLLLKVKKDVRQLNRSLEQGNSRNAKLDLKASPVYIRSDLSFGVVSGGSVGHIAGVLNQLSQFGSPPVFLTTDLIPLVSSAIEAHLFRLDESFWNFRELPSFHLNEVILDQAPLFLAERKPAFIYQRYSLNNYAGISWARSHHVPFVLEYNGSELWINRHWGKTLKYEEVSSQIELINLRGADVVVVVSKPLRQELISRGIESRKILVNPNGVDPDRYAPDIDGSGLRENLGLAGKVVIAFIGTFGRWHGAEVLADAFGHLLETNPSYRSRISLLLIGDGIMMPAVKECLLRRKATENCILTGLISQEKGPAYLAAADILVAPHVPNPDGTRFFGSPTKLFEYMAMGKGIVASNLDQIGEVLEHGKTGWMVTPGDLKSLSMGLKTLVDNRDLRLRLGQAARKEVVSKYSWKEHTARIIDKLKECSC